MSSPLIPQELYLIERYSSLAYFTAMRDAFDNSVTAAEEALNEFMKALPSAYRSQHQSKQPDIVWGEHVLVNLRDVVEALDIGLEKIRQGDLEGLGFSGNVKSAQAAVNRDFPCEWMPEPYLTTYDSQDGIASELASNIQFTATGGWYLGDLTVRYDEESRGSLDLPTSWPIYRLNNSVRVKSGEKVVKSGVYLPDADDSCAELLIAGYIAWQANIGYDPETTHCTHQADTTWTLIERVADSGGGTPGEEACLSSSSDRKRVEGGQPCPTAGWWITPANAKSRGYFKAGVVMPDFGDGSDYGHTIWQWDADQSGPTL